VLRKGAVRALLPKRPRPSAWCRCASERMTDTVEGSAWAKETKRKRDASQEVMAPHSIGEAGEPPSQGTWGMRRGCRISWNLRRERWPRPWLCGQIDERVHEFPTGPIEGDRPFPSRDSSSSATRARSASDSSSSGDGQPWPLAFCRGALAGSSGSKRPPGRASEPLFTAPAVQHGSEPIPSGAGVVGDPPVRAGGLGVLCSPGGRRRTSTAVSARRSRRGRRSVGGRFRGKRGVHQSVHQSAERFDANSAWVAPGVAIRAHSFAAVFLFDQRAFRRFWRRGWDSNPR